MIWRRVVGPFLLVLVCASRGMAGHGANDLLDSHRGTPGVELELIALPARPSPSAGVPAVEYRLRATGVPRNVLVDIWDKKFGEFFHQIAGGFRVDETGALVSRDEAGDLKRLDEMTFEPGPYPRGAAWEVALASIDRKVMAFAKVIPKPITGKSGTCVVSLELASSQGTRFVGSGTGFVPGDDVAVESRFAGRVVPKRQRIGGDGRLPQDLILLGGDSTDRRAIYAVKGRACDVILEYEWGASALTPR